MPSYTLSNYQSIIANGQTVNKVVSVHNGVSTTVWVRPYFITLRAGDYVSTLRYKVNNGSWSSAASLQNIQGYYGDIVYWELVSYNTSDVQYTYDGSTSGSFYIQNGNQTVNRTRKVNQYTVSWTTSNCSVVVRKGATDGTIISSGAKVDYGTWIYVSATANSNHVMNSYEPSFMVTGNTTKSYSASQATKTATVKLWIDGYDDDGYDYDTNSCVVSGSGTINNITLTGGPSTNLLRFNVVTSNWSSVLSELVAKGTNYWDINRSGSGLRMYLSPGYSDPWGTYEVTLLINYTGNLTFTT